MEPAETPTDQIETPSDSASSVPLTITWIVLGLLSAAIAVRGAIMVAGIAQVRSETFARNWPTTGPYTEDELSAASALAAEHLAITQGELTTPTTQLIESAAASQRLLEQGKYEIWRDRRAHRLAAAQARRPLAWGLVALGIGLAAVFAWAARMTHVRGRA